MYIMVLFISLSLSLPLTQQVMGNEAVRTPGCITFIEREKWTEVDTGLTLSI